MLKQGLLQTNMKLRQTYDTLTVLKKSYLDLNTNKKHHQDLLKVPPNAVSHRNALMEAEGDDFVSLGSKYCLEKAHRKPRGNAFIEDSQGQSGKYLRYKN